MSSPKDQYPNALKVVQQIINLTEGQDCIFRGESALYEYPCSSTLYRELKRVNATPRSIPGLLKQKQNRLIEQMRPHDDEGKNDLERLMACQHKGAKTNLLDFTGDHAVALFFACFDDENEDGDGQVLIKQKGMFPKLETEKGELSNDETVLLEPPKRLRRAKDQKGVLVHVPNGSLPITEGETVVIRAEWKQEIVEYLEKTHKISHETLFDDIEGVIARQDREIKQSAPEAVQAPTSLRGFAKPKDNRNILAMEYYVRLSGTPLEGFYRELLSTHANTLITSFTDILEHNPRDADAYFNRAFVHQSKPDPNYEQAISDYTHAIGFKLNYVEAYNNRGIAYMAKSDPDYERAISDFSRTTELSPNYAGAYYNRGIAHADKPVPDYDKAISDYTRAIELDPGMVLAHYNRGVIRLNKPDPDYGQAELDFTRAIELDPNYAKAYNNRATAITEKGTPDYTQVISDYTRAIELDPNYAMAYVNRGIAYTNKPDPDYTQAISDCTRAIELNPHFAGSYNVRGNVYAKIQRPNYKQALLDYTSAIELNPDYTEAYHNRGVTYAEKPDPDYDRAIADYTKVLELNPALVMTYYTRGTAYAQKPNPDHDRAIKDFSQVISRAPDYALAYYGRAVSHARKSSSNYIEMLRDCNRAIALEPKFAHAYLMRATVCASLGDLTQAKEDYDMASKIEPEIAKSAKFIDLRKHLDTLSEEN